MRQRRRASPGAACAAPADAPLVIVAKVGGLLRFHAVSPEAARRGLKVGMPLSEARAFVPVLDIVEADFAADSAFLAAIADWCDRFTPLVGLEGEDGLLLDMTGCTHLFGGEAPALARIRQLLAGLRLTVAGAFAGTAEAAAACTRVRDETIMPPGGERQALQPFPIAALALDAATALGLHRAGFTTIGDVAARGRGELAARFGAPLVDRLDRALGLTATPISPRRPPPAYIAERRFAEPVATDGVVREALARLAGTLCTMLEAREEGLRRAEAVFFRADGAVRRIAVETARPVRAPEVLLRLFGERLSSLADPIDPGFGFDLIRLAAAVVEPLVPQARSLDAAAEEDAAEAIDGLIDRLSARLGPRRVLRLAPADTHVPEASFRAIPAQAAGHHEAFATPWIRLGVAGEPPIRPIRLFARPEPVEVVAEVPDGPPLRFRWRRALHQVAFAEGPERIAMEWWRHGPDAPTRDYYRVEDADGRRFWLFRDGLYGVPATRPAWYMHGLFA